MDESRSIDLAAAVAAPVAVAEQAAITETKADSSGRSKQCKVSKPPSFPATAANSFSKANPHRNLSAYNFYMKYYRTVLVTPGMSFDALDDSLTFDQKHNHIIQVLDNDPYRLKAGEKRAHRMSHGTIGFKELTRRASTSWRSLEGDTRAVFQDIAKEANRSKGEPRMRNSKTAAKEKITRTSKVVSSSPTVSSTSSDSSLREESYDPTNGPFTASMGELLRQHSLLTCTRQNFAASNEVHAVTNNQDYHKIAAYSSESSNESNGLHSGHVNTELASFLTTLDWSKL